MSTQTKLFGKLCTFGVPVIVIYFGVSTMLSWPLTSKMPSHRVSFGEKNGKFCEKKLNYMFVKVHKAGSTTSACILQRFGYENNLTFVLPMKGQSNIGEKHGGRRQLSPEASVGSEDSPEVLGDAHSSQEVEGQILPAPSGTTSGALQRGVRFSSDQFNHPLPPSPEFEVQYAKEPQKDAKDFPTIPNRLVQAYHGPTEPRHHPKDPQWLKGSPLSAGQGRKILLDCGANVASTVQLFRETYPGGHDFIIHSFEIDERLAPFFAPYPNHVLHCPTGVSNKDGQQQRPRGGGTLFAWDSEKADTETGGRRKLSLRPTVPTVDLSRWIQENTAVEDYVIFKLDVEGAEYDILKKMLADGTFKYYGEYHPTQPVTGWNEEEMLKLKSEVNTKGKHMLVWKGELRTYQDFNTMNPPLAQSTLAAMLQSLVNPS
ncbi:hypothetical protein Bbelb_193100 [Branchiostoma belcheri]|nr:hypothetical protein Bbelb_193100 [Branchiostoma belcheri]